MCSEIITEIDYLEVINRHIQVMDHTALTMCREAKVPIVVFNMIEEGNIERVISGDPEIGTIIKSST